MDVLTEPSLEAAHRFLTERIRGGTPPPGVLVLVGRCEVRYEGRAASTLDGGDRLVLLKPDGTLLLHGPAGTKPVNWQPPGATFDVELGPARLVLWSRRPRPVEVLEIRFESVLLASLVRLKDGAELHLQGSEFDLRDLLRARPELVEPGFRPWERERITDQGPMDLYGEDAQGRRVVIEVKRVRAGLAEATQLWRYVEAERRRRGVSVRGILVAPGISDRARTVLVEHGLEFLERTWDDARVAAVRKQAGPRQPSLAAFGEARERTDRL